MREQEVIAVLVESHRELLAFVERRVGDRALAEDILQEAFVRGIERADSIENAPSARAWLYRVLRNAIIDQARRRRSAARALEAFAAELDEAAPSQEADAAVCGCVARLAGTLKPEYAEALQKMEVEGMAVKDFAGAAGISANNAAVRLFRAREALRRQLTAACGTCATHGCLDCTCAV